MLWKLFGLIFIFIIIIILRYAYHNIYFWLICAQQRSRIINTTTTWTAHLHCPVSWSICKDKFYEHRIAGSTIFCDSEQLCIAYHQCPKYTRNHAIEDVVLILCRWEWVFENMRNKASNIIHLYDIVSRVVRQHKHFSIMIGTKEWWTIGS